MKEKLLALVLCGVALGAVPSPAITFSPFGPKGEGGSKNGQTFTIGTGGVVFELDGFLQIGGLDLNGSQFGVSAQLSRDALPAGVVYSFTNSLSTDQADLVLAYTFSNTTSTVFSDLHFFVLLDAEIDEEINTFFNEYGSTNGALGLHGYDASEWQIDEPGFGTGTLLKNLFKGALSGSNAVPANAPNDVAQALGFSLGNLNPGAASTVEVLISEQGLALGSFSLAQHDRDSASTTAATMSGVIVATASQIADPPHELLVLNGQVVRDANTNGPPAPSSNGVSGVTVLLLSNSVPVRTNLTDSAGRYYFSVPPGLKPGTYAVQADAAGLTFVPVPPSQKAYFAASNPSPVTLPMLVPILNFDVRGTVVQQFENVSEVLHFGFRSWALNHATGSLLGTLSITNPVNSSASFGPPWQLGLTSSPNFYYPRPYPDGKLPDGVSYVDVSAAVSAQVPGGILNPGQWVTLTNAAVEVYSLYRTAPTNTLFELWATQQ
jgi:hypothetical protein